MSAATTVKIVLAATRRTDVLCVSCGNFGAEQIILRGDDSETDAGVHARCIAEIKRGRVQKAEIVVCEDDEAWPGRPGPGGP